MRPDERGPFTSIGIVMVALAVAFCFVLPMVGGSAMHVAMVCCFVLAILLIAVVLVRPTKIIAIAPPLARRPLRPSDILAVARAPNPVALGALLI